MPDSYINVYNKNVPYKVTKLFELFKRQKSIKYLFTKNVSNMIE